jgi:hypothetical protein
MALRECSSRSRRASLGLVLLSLVLLACCVGTAVPQAHALTAPAPEACPATSGAAEVPASPNLAAPAPAATQIVVCVHDLPILGATYTHWAEVAKKSEGPKPKHSATAREVTEEVLGFLISSDWILEEAHRRHVEIPARTVRRSFERIRAKQFPKHGEFGAFLKSSGQTTADLEFRVKLNLLSGRLTARVLASQHTARAKQHALANFVKGFKSRWQSTTYCTSEYAVLDCGHVVAPPL